MRSGVVSETPPTNWARPLVGLGDLLGDGQGFIDGLDAAAIEGVNQWEYEPTLLNGEPVSVTFTVRVNFTLSGDDSAGEPKSEQ